MYLVKTSFVVGDPYYHYYLDDRYMTIQNYDLGTNANILASEKQEILARLRRVKAETELQQKERH